MLRFYKPSPSNKGHACSFYTTKDGHFFACLIKQDSWDAVKKIGSFSKNVKNPEANVFVKLSAMELAGILDAIDTGRPFSGYHDSGKDYTLMIKFEPYEYNGKKGHSFMVTRINKQDSSLKTSFIIGFSFAEGRLLKEHLTFLLHESFKTNSNENYNTPVGNDAANPTPALEVADLT